MGELKYLELWRAEPFIAPWNLHRDFGHDRVAAAAKLVARRDSGKWPRPIRRRRRSQAVTQPVPGRGGATGSLPNPRPAPKAANPPALTLFVDLNARETANKP